MVMNDGYLMIKKFAQSYNRGILTLYASMCLGWRSHNAWVKL